MKAMESPEQPRSTALRKWGPLGAVVVVVAVVAGFLVLGGGDDESTDSAGPSTTAPGADLADVELPNGVLPYSVAEARGEEDDIDWGERCDDDRGGARPAARPAAGVLQALHAATTAAPPPPASPPTPSRSWCTCPRRTTRS